MTRTGPRRVNSTHATPIRAIVRRPDAHLPGVGEKIAVKDPGILVLRDASSSWGERRAALISTSG